MTITFQDLKERLEEMAKKGDTFLITEEEDDKGKTLLLKTKDLDIIKLLVQYGANVEHVDEEFNTVLHQKFKEEDIPLIEFIASINKDLLNEKDKLGRTPLFHQDVEEVIKKMVELGARIDVYDNWGVGLDNYWNIPTLQRLLNTIAINKNKVDLKELKEKNIIPLNLEIYVREESRVCNEIQYYVDMILLKYPNFNVNINYVDNPKYEMTKEEVADSLDIDLVCTYPQFGYQDYTEDRSEGYLSVKYIKRYIGGLDEFKQYFKEILEC